MGSLNDGWRPFLSQLCKKFGTIDLIFGMTPSFIMEKKSESISSIGILDALKAYNFGFLSGEKNIVVEKWAPILCLAQQYFLDAPNAVEIDLIIRRNYSVRGKLDLHKRSQLGFGYLHWASCYQTAEQFEQTLVMHRDQGIDITASDSFITKVSNSRGMHPILLAAVFGNIAAVEQLILAGVDIDFRTPGSCDQQTALHLSVLTGNNAMFRRLLALDANVKISATLDGKELQIIDLITEFYSVDILRAYLAFKSCDFPEGITNDQRREIFDKTIESGQLKRMNPTFQSSLRGGDYDPTLYRLLYACVERGNAKALRFLLSLNFDVNCVRDHMDYGLLSHAIMKRQPKVIPVLIAAGIDVNQLAGPTMRMPLDIALTQKSAEVTRLLFNCGRMLFAPNSYAMLRKKDPDTIEFHHRILSLIMLLSQSEYLRKQQIDLIKMMFEYAGIVLPRLITCEDEETKELRGEFSVIPAGTLFHSMKEKDRIVSLLPIVTTMCDNIKETHDILAVAKSQTCHDLIATFEQCSYLISRLDSNLFVKAITEAGVAMDQQLAAELIQVIRVGYFYRFSNTDMAGLMSVFRDNHRSNSERCAVALCYYMKEVNALLDGWMILPEDKSNSFATELAGWYNSARILNPEMVQTLVELEVVRATERVDKEDEQSNNCIIA